MWYGSGGGCYGLYSREEGRYKSGRIQMGMRRRHCICETVKESRRYLHCAHLVCWEFELSVVVFRHVSGRAKANDHAPHKLLDMTISCFTSVISSR